MSGVNITKLIPLLMKEVLSPKVSFTLLVISSICLFAPPSFLENLKLKSTISEQKSIVGAVFIGSLALLTTSFLSVIGSWFKMRFEWWKMVRAENRHLHALSPEEKQVLSDYINNETKTLYFDYRNGVVKGLCDKNVLYRATEVATRGFDFPFNLQPWAWKYLNKKPSILYSKTASLDQ